MATQPFETRLSAVEQALAELVQAQARTQSQLDQLAAERLTEQAERRAEQAERRAEQAARRAQSDELAAERLADRAERRAFEAELRATVSELRAADKRMQEQAARSDRQWGELANKMGTLTEDIVLPGIPTVFRTFFAAQGAVDLAVRVHRHHPADPGRSEEYDAIVTGGDVLLVAESKSRLRPENVGEFRDKLSAAREFLPEAAGKRVVGLLASFYLDPALVTAGERQGLIMVGLGTGLLRILNTPGFSPRAF